MKESKYLLCMCVLLRTLAISNMVRAGDATAEEATQRRVEVVAELSAAHPSASADAFVGDAPSVTRPQRKVLRLYEKHGPDITSAIISYFKQTGATCTEKRLALSVVGGDSGQTRVKSLLRKLGHIFNVSKNEKLILSSSGAWHSLLKPDPSRASLPRDLHAHRDDVPIRDICTSALFVGRLPQHSTETYTCADVSLDDMSLAALPVATEAALPAVIMVPDKTDERARKGDEKKPEVITGLVSVKELLRGTVPATSRLYLTTISPAWEHDPAESDDGFPTLELAKEDEFQRLSPYNVYLHSQHQLDLIFPAGMYDPVYVVDPETRSIEVGSRAVHAYPALSSSYVCTGRRRVRLVERSWEALRKRESSEPTSPHARKNKWKFLAKLLAARAGSKTEQHPQVVLLRLFINTENKQEHWQEERLGWIEEPLEHKQSPANVQAFRQVLAADAQAASNFNRLLNEASLRRVLPEKFIHLYNINKEEMYSMWDEDTRHSAVDPSNMNSVFTRPINMPIFRPVDPRDVLVSPADSVIQQLYQLTPNTLLQIRDLFIPDVKDTQFSLSEFLYGDNRRVPVHLKDMNHRLNVVVHHLSPHDYHRVHSPADWTIKHTYHIPACFPADTVRRPAPGESLHTVERTSLIGKWDPEEKGEELFFAVVLVGAEYTGGIRLAWEDQPHHNRHALKQCSEKDITYSPKAVPLCLGDELGEFIFGSTVVMLFETDEGFEMNANTCDAVLVGHREGLRKSGGRKTRSKCASALSAFGSPSLYLDYLRRNPVEAGKRIMEDKQLPEAWRANAQTAASEVARATEKGLVFANALAQKILHFSANNPQDWERIFIGQPVDLLKSESIDAAILRAPVTCYPEPDKTKIRVKFQGQHSTLVLVIKTDTNDQILFGRPHFGCDGHPHLGNRAGGLYADWILSGGGHLDVKLTVKCGLGDQRGCVESDGAPVLEGQIDITGMCPLDWARMRPGSTVAECRVGRITHRVTRATSLVVRTKEFTCDATKPLLRARP